MRQQYVEDLGSSDTGESSLPSSRKHFSHTAVRTRWTNIEFICFSTIYLVSINNYFTEFYYNHTNNPSYIQYIICMLLVGMPIQYMQITLGQYTQMSSIYLKYMSPICHGIGYSMIVSSLLRIFPYGVLAGDCLLYLLNCMQTTLPWHVCDKKYKTICWEEHYCKNKTAPCISTTKFLPSYLYWNLTFMEEIPDNFEFTSPNMRRLVATFCMWFAIFSILLNTTSIIQRGMRYIFYIAFGFVIFLLIGLLLMNKSAKKGLGYLVHISMDQLTNPRAWAMCMVDVVETLKLGCGGFMLLGSHLAPESYSGLMTVLSIAIFMCVHLMFMLTIHVAIAILADAAGLDKENIDLVKTNFEFVEMTVIPNSLLYTNIPQLWNLLYFASSMTFAYTSILINLRIVEITLADLHPIFVRYRKYILMSLLISCMLITLFFTTKGTLVFSGYSYTKSLDSFDLYLVCVFTMIVSWIYGVQRLCDDIHFIIGVQPANYWKITWNFSPILMLICSVVDTKEFGIEAHPFRIFLFVLFIFPFVLLMVYEAFRHIKKRNLVGLFQPEELWGPPEQEARKMRVIFNPRKEIRYKRRNETCLHRCLIGSKVLKRLVAEEEKFHMYFEESQRADSVEVRQ